MEDVFKVLTSQDASIVYVLIALFNFLPNKISRQLTEILSRVSKQLDNGDSPAGT